MLRFFRELLSTIRLYRNFFAYWRERFGFFPNRIVVFRMRNGLQCAVRTNTTDVRVMSEVWQRGLYDRFLPTLQSDSTVIDVGAGVGVFTLKAARLVSRGKVIACEPAPRAMSVLKQNITDNRVQEIVIPVEHAIAGKTGRADLFTHEGNAGGASFYTHGDRERAALVQVQTFSLADLFKKFNISHCALLKMDSEGAEEEILLGTPPALFVSIAAMTIQWHDDLSERGLQALLDFLKQQGYAVEFEKTTSMIYVKR
jgi:FkbM family methyltransferase